MGGTISGSLIKCRYHLPLLITVLWIRANRHRRTGGQSGSRSSATHILTHPIRAPDVGTFPAGMGLCRKSPPHITGPGYRMDARGRPHSGAEGKGECWVGWRHAGWVSSSHTHLWREVNCCNMTWYPEVEMLPRMLAWGSPLPRGSECSQVLGPGHFVVLGQSRSKAIGSASVVLHWGHFASSPPRPPPRVDNLQVWRHF